MLFPGHLVLILPFEVDIFVFIFKKNHFLIVESIYDS